MIKPRVLIVGAGIGGLSLAQGLKKARVPFQIFECELEDEYPQDTYRIRITEEGAAALRKVLPPELWDEFERTCALTEPSIITIDALDGNAVQTELCRKLNSEPYVADKAVLLRNVLMQGVHANITFGKEFTGYTATSAGVYAKFSDGTSSKGTLLVGADGSNSRVCRQFLPNHSVYDTQSWSIYGRSDITSELLDLISPHIMNCATISQDNSYDPTLTLITEPTRFKWDPATSELPQDHVSWILLFQRKFHENENFSKLSRLETAQLTLHMTQRWHRSLRTLLDLQDPSQTSAIPIMTAKPEIPTWPLSSQVTLLGDSIHVMSPVGGTGATLALRDAANLASVLAGGISMEGISRYEERMREYAAKALQTSIVDASFLLGSQPFEKLRQIDT